MEHKTGRVYRRHKRKLACRYCSSRHIRCKPPEGFENTDDRTHHRSCQACLDAHEPCELQGAPRAQYVSHIGRNLDAARASGTMDLSRQLGPFAERDGQESGRERVTGSMKRGSGSVGESSGRDGEGKRRKKSSDTMLVHLLMDLPEHDAGDDDSLRQRSDKVLYFGNDSIWSYSLQKARNSNPKSATTSLQDGALPSPDNMHYNVPAALQHSPSDGTEEDLHLKRKEMKLLHDKGAFSLPPVDVQRALLDAYFLWLYPLQPILDKRQFLYDLENGQLSIILLKAVLFAGATCCDEDIVKRAWDGRRDAQARLFRQIKALYDADYESDRITIVQVLCLMTFWWGSPTEEKDFRHWLAGGINQAQATGMHRSTRHSRLPAKERSLWKRIWWTFYVRDHFDSAALGRPMLIRDDDCDIEPLNASDFEGTEMPDGSSVGPAYCIEMTKLAVIIGRIITAGQQNKIPASSVAQIDECLSAWQQALPPQLCQSEGQSNPQAKLFGAMLTLGFHFCKIRLHRDIFLDTKSGLHSSSTAAASANAVTRVVEELMTDGTLHRTQVYLIVVIFASFTVHIISLQQSEGTRQRVLQHKAQMCILGLCELKEYWPWVGWMYRVFSLLLERLRSEDGQAIQPAALHPYPSLREPGPSEEVVPYAAEDPPNRGISAPLSPHRIEGEAVGDVTALPPGLDQDWASVGDFLQPFMSLDTLAWYGRTSDPLATLSNDTFTVPTWPNNSLDFNALFPLEA